MNTLNDNLIKFNALESSEDRKAQMEEHKQDLLKYFKNNEKINEVMISIKDLISVIKRDNSNSVSHLSVNSKDDRNFKFNED